MATKTCPSSVETHAINPSLRASRPHSGRRDRFDSVPAAARQRRFTSDSMDMYLPIAHASFARKVGGGLMVGRRDYAPGVLCPRINGERAAVRIRLPRHVLSGAGIVLELRKGFQRVFRGAGKHHLLVFHLKRAERHHDVFRANTKEAPDRQHREGDLFGRCHD
jgi:hypothetical protein